ncbi:VOC family protein [Salana multivorans]
MRVDRIVPNLTVTDLDLAVREHQDATGLEVLMDHGWIVTLGDEGRRRQLSLMTTDLTAQVNPAVSVFVDDVHEALERVQAAGLEIVHPLTDEPWGVTRFFYRDSQGHVVNIGMHTPTS